MGKIWIDGLKKYKGTTRRPIQVELRQRRSIGGTRLAYGTTRTPVFLVTALNGCTGGSGTQGNREVVRVGGIGIPDQAPDAVSVRRIRCVEVGLKVVVHFPKHCRSVEVPSGSLP